MAGQEGGRELALTPTDKTLHPEVERSKDWDTTQNLYIEGDNLEALKILRSTYAGKVKLIYIDPPYNTGHDFVYKDNFATDADAYKAANGDYSADGAQLVANPESNGRFHSDWCSMIYPRLLLARDFLTQDGAIFISIDDNEQANLKKICDEIFGPANFIAQFVWSGGRKNDSKFVSVSHEYILCYARSKQTLQDNKILWREKKEGLDEIYAEYRELKKTFDNDYSAISDGLKAWFNSLPTGHPSLANKHYNRVDERGIYFPGDISWPGGGGPRYQVLHPVTHKPVTVPSRGWIFTTSDRMREMINNGYVEFGEDETKVPCLKRYLSDHEYQAPYSVFYQDSRAATKRLRSLMGADVFDHPKDETIIQTLIDMVGTKDDSIVMDFFSGSATTAHAVMKANAEDGGNRKFILVQLPEVTDEKSEAYKAGYHTICEMGEERIRRAGEQIKAEIDKENAQITLDGEQRPVPDVGFRVLSVGDSNWKDAHLTPGEYKQGELFDMVDTVKPGHSPLDCLFECLPVFQIEPSASITQLTAPAFDGHTVYSVGDGRLIACLDDSPITEELVTAIADLKPAPAYAVFSQDEIPDSAALTNVTEIMRQRTNDFTRTRIF